ncbi:MAG: type II toxin-antitoxin system VapC family toxin [Nanoarchaeota archaeon]
MGKSGYYVDSCIYINLWQNETGNPLFPFWKSAQAFLKRCEEEGNLTYYSGYVLKEIEHVLGNEIFIEKREIFLKNQNMIRLFATDEELALGRKLEAQLEYSISFFDIMHMILAKRADAILVTRDRKLIIAAIHYGAETKKPEQCLD